MDTVAERIDKVLNIGDFKSRAQMCDVVGIPYGTLNNWIKRGRIAPSGVLTITEKYPQISKTYLETGKGDILKLDTGISNYGHDARMQEVCEAYQRMSNEDKQVAYRLILCLSKSSENTLKNFDESFKEK